VAGELGLDPDTVRKSIHTHQSARPAAYLLVRRTLEGDYLAVADVPWPAGQAGPIRAGDMVLDRSGRAFPNLQMTASATRGRVAISIHRER